jgi:hypothetical protein
MHLWLCLLLSLCLAGVEQQPVYAEDSLSYRYYIDQAQEALDRNDYESALDYFRHAHLINPAAQYPVEKIEQIQDVMAGHGDAGELPAGHTNRSYRLFLGLGKNEFARRNYNQALLYFQTAVEINPDEVEANHYINLIKRAQDHRLTHLESPHESPKAAQRVSGETSGPLTPRQEAIDAALQRAERDLTVEHPAAVSLAASSSLIKEPSSNTVQNAEIRPVQTNGTKTILLDDALWATQPKTRLRIAMKSSLILEGRNIDRFLIVTPGGINVERIDRDHIRVTGDRIGTTYLHVWDERGRWTFYVECILPIQHTSSKVSAQNAEEESASPFKFNYAVDGGTLYQGPTMPSAKRKSLDLQQTLGVVGDTPYGTSDAAVSYTKINDSTKVSSYTLGLTGAKAPGFTDVTVRGFDASRYFSALTFPGQYFRGFLVEGKTLGENLGVTYLRGRDRFTYSFLSSVGDVQDRKSYVEGTRVVLFPKAATQYGFNYARGFGSDRQPFLKDEVYSLDAKRRFEKGLLAGEVATNKDNKAELFTSKFDGDHQTLRASFRDIDKDFTAVSNAPANQGEIGTLLSGDWNYDRFEVSTNADFYQQRLLSNTKNPDAVNSDLDATVRIPLADRTTWQTSGYFLNTPGELSPRRNVRLVNNLTQRYNIWDNRLFEVFIGSTYQRSRISESFISDYDRYSATTGFRLGLLRNLSYYTNYEYSWVDNIGSDKITNPSVLNTGFDYSRELTKRLSGNIGFYYRNEENTQGTNSFLAGEDSINGTVGMSYRPTNDAEIFWDSRVRNVWRENPDNAAYNEIDVRWGLRSSWDLPVVWNPHGLVKGRIYKDLNRNGKYDAAEPGMSNVVVKVGKQEVKTDAGGHYSAEVRAKKVLVIPDLSTVQPGYILNSPAVLNIKIPEGKSIDFGFTTDSGIYGVVFYDKNGNQQPDEGDVFLSNVKLTLDHTIKEKTEFDGTYFFKNVPGGKHTIQVDINSIPIEYIPLVKISNSIEVTEGTTYVYHIPLKKK